MFRIKKQIKSLLTFLRVQKGRINGASIEIEQDSYISYGCFFSSGRTIRIGNGSYIGRYVALSCHVDIGKKVLVASNVAFVGGDHRIDNINGYIMDSGRDEIKKTIVDNDVWIGHGAIILHGVHLEQGCVVAAGSVVTKDVKKDQIVGGNPAKHIRFRKS
ncbi:acyltransferase [Vibrio fluvialis]|nr:acyltransferase [Vibrio fluvialis]